MLPQLSVRRYYRWDSGWKHTLTVLLYFTHLTVFSQKDSLLLRLEMDLTSRERIEAQIGLADLMKDLDFFESERLALEALSEARSEKLLELEGRCQRVLGVNYWLHGQYPASTDALSEARRILISLNMISEYAKATNTLGLVYYYQAEYDTAAFFLQEALENHQQVGDTSQIARVSNNLGLLYGTRGDFVNSTHYLIMSTRYKILYTSLRDRDGMHRSQKSLQTNNLLIEPLALENYEKLEDAKASKDQLKLAETYSKLGKVHQIREHQDSANYYFQQSSEIYKKLNWPRKYFIEQREIARTLYHAEEYSKALRIFESIENGLKEQMVLATYADVLGNLYNLHMRFQNFALAKSYADKGLNQARSLNHRTSICRFLRYQALVSFKMNKPDDGLEYLKSSYELAQNTGSFSQLRESANQLYQFYSQKGDAESALQFHEEVVRMDKRMNEAESRRQVLEFQIKSELEDRKNTIDRLNQEKENNASLIQFQQLVLVLVALLLVLLIISFLLLYSRYKKIKLLKQNISDQNRLLNARNKENETLVNEIHHRVKNNLQMIGSLLNMQNRRITSPEGKEMLNLTRSRIQSIGLVHEHLFKYERYSKISLKPYIENLTEMVLDSSSVPVELSLEVDDFEVDIETAIPLALILNELLTNSQKYGVNTSLKLEMKVIAIAVSNEFILQVIDNGPGCEDFKKGFGWTIIQTFLGGLNGASTVDPTNGMDVTIRIPLKEIRIDNSGPPEQILA